MDNLIEIITVPIITTAVYGLMELYKKAIGEKKTLIKLIPLLSVMIGAIAGAVLYFAFPEIIPSGCLLPAILIGAASGLAATGTNQILKQLSKEEEQEESEEKDEEKYEDKVEYKVKDEVKKK